MVCASGDAEAHRQLYVAAPRKVRRGWIKVHRGVAARSTQRTGAQRMSYTLAAAAAACGLNKSMVLRANPSRHPSPSVRRFLFVIKGFSNIGSRRMISQRPPTHRPGIELACCGDSHAKPLMSHNINSLKKKCSTATIVADGKRFSHQINTDEVFGTHNGRPNAEK